MPFRDIVGHRHLLDLIAGAATRGSLPPSLIFAGPEGVGKRAAALALAQLVNCSTPVQGRNPAASTPDLLGKDLAAPDVPINDACGTCASCARIARLVHADVLLVEPGDTGVIKIEQVREAVERTAYRPFEGRRRVVIVDEADTILSEAQNALLKTLEEPPSASMFVLVSSRPDELLPTVRSRCQRLRFGRLSAGDIAAVLMQAHDLSSSDAHAAAAAADGSIGQALEGGATALVEAREAAAEVLSHVAGTRDPRRRLESGKVLAGGGDRDGLRRRLRALASMVRDLGVIGVGAPAINGRYLANADLEEPLRRLAASFDRERVSVAFAAIDRALEAIDRNASPKIVADWLAFQL
jgi:DNA polymerase III subunit delta'